MRNRFALLLLAVTWTASAAPDARYRVVRSYPHDKSAFVEGLEFRDGFIYESTGIVGRSNLRKLKLETGAVVQNFDVPGPYFGEGFTIIGQQIVQLTWQHQTGFVYDKATLKLLRSFSYPGEGWALTNDGKPIYMSDGTPQIRVWEPAAFRELRRLNGTDNGKPVRDINELEFVRGEIYANVWHTDRIARISPTDGKVLGWIDLRGLLPAAERPGDPEGVLNGIAFDAATGRLFVTGKLWPKIFEIQVVR